MLSLRLAERLVFRLGASAAFLPLGAVLALVVATNVFMDQQVLTGDQRVQRELGAFQAVLVRNSAHVAPSSDALDVLRRELIDEGLKVELELHVPDLPLFQLDADGVFYQEMDWSTDPFPEAASLIEGRMPEHPGEIAVVGGRLRKAVQIGSRLPLMSQGEELQVVGILNNKLGKDSLVLGAAGTLGRTRPTSVAETDALTGSLSAYFREQPNQSQLNRFDDLLSQAGLSGKSSSVQNDGDSLAGAFLDRSTVASDVEPPWTARSPLYFRLPVLALTPLAVAVGTLILLRRLRPAGMIMSANGVPRSAAALAGLWVVAAWTLLVAIPALVIGCLLGESGVGVAARFGWGNPAATWRLPLESVVLVPFGLVCGLLAAYGLLQKALGPRRTLTGPEGVDRPDSDSKWRTALRLLTAAVGLSSGALAVTVNRPSQAMVFSALAAVLAALVSPSVLDRLLRSVPQRSLRVRLCVRLMAANRDRLAATLAALTITIAASIGVLTTVNSSVRDQELRTAAVPLPGQLGLDNDQSTFMPVAPEVTELAEGVEALRRQAPVQLWAAGRFMAPSKPGDVADLAMSVTSADLRGVVYGLDAPADLERLIQRRLLPAERSTLASGGVLVVDSRVSISNGHVDLVDGDGRPGPTLLAVSSDIRVPWFEGSPAVALRGSLTAKNIPTYAAATVYTGLSLDEISQVQERLASHGVSPEYANAYRELPALIPPAALVIACLSMFCLTLALASSVTRAQVLSMRRWASRLTHIGVPPGWARTVLVMQFTVILLLAVGAGAAAGLLPLLWVHLRVPSISLHVPWRLIVPMLLTVTLAVVAAAATASRRLTAVESLGWNDPD